jgi:hypothetical protein
MQEALRVDVASDTQGVTPMLFKIHFLLCAMGLMMLFLALQVLGK